MGKFDGQVALVTGGARGQGRSHAIALAKEGAQIALVDICEPIANVEPYEPANEDDLAEAARLVEEQDQRCLAIKADARDAEQMKSAADRVIDEFGQIDVALVNHAVTASHSWDDQGDVIWDAVIEGALTSAWKAARAIVPHMAARESGSLIFTSSVSGAAGHAGFPSYIAAKWGVIGMMKALSAELAPVSVRVNAILPSAVATPMLHSQAVIDAFAGHPNAHIDEMRFATESFMLLPVPWLETADVSAAVLYLASEDARYVTGVALPVDGGTLNQPPGIPPIAVARLIELEESS